MSTVRPTFFQLTHDEALALIERTHVGRLAFSFRDRVDIEPISYVYSNGWLYARTSPGTKLEVVHHHPFVAFEVDEVEGRYDWRCVVMRGSIYFLDADRGERERERFDAAVAVLRADDSDALTENDPAPFRREVFGIHIDEITGRGARSA